VLTPPDNGSSIVSVHLNRNQARAREVLDKNGVQVSFRAKELSSFACHRRFSTRVTRFDVFSTTRRASREPPSLAAGKGFGGTRRRNTPEIIGQDSWRREWDSNPTGRFRFCKLQILNCQRCRKCRRCRHAVARAAELRRSTKTRGIGACATRSPAAGYWCERRP
jgi:hypothetical protein